MPAPYPTTPIVKAFGYSAGGGFVQNPIPDTTVTPGRASFRDGFPPVTFDPVAAGGVPPNGKDFNGLFQQITENQAFQTAGQAYKFSSIVAAAIGGYQRGAMVAMSDNTGVWISVADANSDDPDAGSANWAPLYRYDYTTIAGLVGGITNVSFLQARSRVIVLTGALVSAQQIVLPNLLQEWLIVNATTGAFTMTARTVAGVGVPIPQGGFANPSQVYGNGVDIFYCAAPITIPASVSPTNNSIAQRDNTGALFGTRFDDLTNMVNTFGARDLSLSGNQGFYTLPGGFIVNFGRTTAGAGIITYDQPYSAYSIPVIAHTDRESAISSATTHQFTWNHSGSAGTMWWIAVGA